MASGEVYWITGLSGTGKSVLATALKEALAARGEPAVLLDGDAVRELILEKEGYDRESRWKIAMFNAKLCRFLSLQGLTVICATISLFHDVQAWSRANVERYKEILLEAPMALLEQRDPKGIYRRAREGELKHVVGVHIAPEWPQHPEFKFATDGSMTTQAMIEKILSRSMT